MTHGDLNRSVNFEHFVSRDADISMAATPKRKKSSEQELINIKIRRLDKHLESLEAKKSEI